MFYPPPGPLSEALDSDLSFITYGDDGAFWSPASPMDSSYYDGDSADSGGISADEESWLQTVVDVENDQETVTFYWKVSSEENNDYLQFYIDGVLKDQISGEVDWQQKSYSVTGSGVHLLQWCYVKDSSVSEGEDRGWVDYVQWTGPSPAQPEDWNTITYKYDANGRRIKKTVDGYTTTYLYDGGSVIAEYDGYNNILYKYIYGPGIDKPICMIDVADSNAVYYYHFDGVGSVVALSDSVGDTIQTYEYSVYGLVAAEDPNHPNPYMFTGRRLDFETGLYYYRARYYNPYIGRFMQTDLIGYADGINLYTYCRNNPLGYTDSSGHAVDWTWYGHFRFLDLDENVTKLTFQYWNEYGQIVTKEFNNLDHWEGWARDYFKGRENEMAGSTLAGGDDELFWELQKMAFLSRYISSMLADIDNMIEVTGQSVTIKQISEGLDRYDYRTNTLYWNYKSRGAVDYFPGEGPERKWHEAPAMVGLAHELTHCRDDLYGNPYLGYASEVSAMLQENYMRWGLYKKVPGNAWIYPRPDYAEDTEDLGSSPKAAWRSYWRNIPFLSP